MFPPMARSASTPPGSPTPLRWRAALLVGALAGSSAGPLACAKSDAITPAGEDASAVAGSGGDPSAGGATSAGGEDPAGTGGASGTPAASTGAGGSDAATTGGSGGSSSTSSGARCGDGSVDEGEDCDGDDIAGATCADQDLGAGVVVCDGDCALDYSDCADAVACENGVDDDDDGLVDAADPACAGAGDDDEAVVSPTCDGAGGPVVDLSAASGVPVVRTGTTASAPAALSAQSTASCPTTPGPEVAFRLVTTVTKDLLLSLDSAGTEADWDPVLYVRSTTCVGTQVGCNDDGDGTLKSKLTLAALPAGTYFVFVDSAGSSGAFELTVTEL